MKQFTILGCGVIGLTAAIRLLEQFERPTTIVAKDFPPNTTSDIAAAIWMPFLVEPQNKALNWSKQTFDRYIQEQHNPKTGIYLTELFEFFLEPVADPYWISAIDRFRYATAEEIPTGYRYGFVAEVPIVETPLYMVYLLDRFRELGGELRSSTVNRIEEITHSDSITINCSGLGSRELMNDDQMFPIRGQIARMEKIDSRRSFTIESGPHAICYILPRSNDTIVGGTALRHVWDTAVDAVKSHELIANARFFEHKLREARLLEDIVGLRPGRTEVRLEWTTDLRGFPVIHNYGHGGSGFTLCWGCANAVCDIVRSMEIQETSKKPTG